jgi:Holliday junction resolvase
MAQRFGQVRRKHGALMPRWAARQDGNSKEIVAKLRQCGVSVLHLHRVGKNAPDLCCGYRGVNYMLEVKSLAKQRGGVGKVALREAAQKAWCENWPGPAAVVRSFEEAWQFIQEARRD